jgi:dipeptidyl aminopeptidase/acylaminoacyl peptidase
MLAAQPNCTRSQEICEVKRRHLILGSAAAGGLTLLPPIAIGQSTRAASDPKVSVEEFFRNPQFDRVTLSPDGQSLAAVVSINGRANLAVIDLVKNEVFGLTNYKQSDVNEYRWQSNRRLLWRLQDPIPDPNYATQGDGLFAINKDGSGFRELFKPTKQGDSARESVSFVYRFVGAEITPIAGGDEILVVTNERSEDSADLYRVNTVDGRRQLVTVERPTHVRRYLIADGKPRIAVSEDPDSGVSTLWSFRSEKDAWTKLEEWDGLTNAGVEPIAFDFDGSLLVSARAGRDKAALYRYDVAAGKLGERLVAHKDYDIGYGNGSFLATSAASDLILDSKKKKVAGIVIQAEKPEFVWFDEQWAGWHAALNKALPERINRMSAAGDSGRILVHSASDRDPGRWYLYEPEKKTLQELIARRAWIRPQQMAERRPVRYAARDGLPIPAYLTLPLGGSKNLPAVMLVHGGPFVRGEFWVFDSWAQFLASRGYAVLQPDYRGSRGYGWTHFTAGWRQLGQAMQNDISDGARWLIQQGIADPKRIGIMGHSAGGWAVMIGLALEPDLYRCGLNSAGVTDWIYGFELRMGGRRVPAAVLKYYSSVIGDPAKDRDALSAVRQANRIKAPVLMAYGAEDPTVPRIDGDRMKSALETAKVPVEYVIYRNQGHWWDETTRIDYFKRAEAFLAKHMA